MPTSESRIRGCLLGGAIGDALGAGVEFSNLADIRRRFGASGITAYADPVGRITDDTQMTLFTAEGLIRASQRVAEEGITAITGMIHRSYLRWIVTQGVAEPLGVTPSVVDGWLVTNESLHVQRAPGITCMTALRSPEMGTVEDPLNDRKGCGGVMRVAPIGVTGSLTDGDVFTVAAEAAAITHGHPSGYLASGVFALVVARVCAGDDLSAAIAVGLEQVAGYEGSDETVRAIEFALELSAGAAVEPETVERLGGGWVAEEALAIGLYCALVANDVHSGLVLAVNHSGDSDSTGSIVGNLLGARLGVEALPTDLLDALAERDLVTAVADDLVATFLANAPPDLDRYPPR